MADLINLKQHRKKRDRARREDIAASNRLYFGQSKLERQNNDTRVQQLERHLNAHKLDGAPEK